MINLDLSSHEKQLYQASHSTLLVTEPRFVRWLGRLARVVLRPFQREPMAPVQTVRVPLLHRVVPWSSDRLKYPGSKGIGKGYMATHANLQLDRLGMQLPVQSAALRFDAHLTGISYVVQLTQLSHVPPFARVPRHVCRALCRRRVYGRRRILAPAHRVLLAAPHRIADSAPFMSGSLTGRLDEACRRAAEPAGDNAERALRVLAEVARDADALSVISENEPLREIQTRSLRVLFIPSVQAELEQSMRVTEGDRMQKRRAQVEASAGAARLFFEMTARHRAVPEAVLVMVRSQASEQKEQQLAPAERRHLKMQLYKMQKELERLLDAFRTEYRAKAHKKNPALPVPPAISDVFYDLLIVPGDTDEDEDEDEESAPSGTYEARPPKTLRDYLLMLLVLHAVRTANTMSSAQQELELLKNAPPPSEAPVPRSDDDTWRLDSRWFSGRNGGPLLGEGGKPLRPFVITGSQGQGPSAPGDRRSQLQAQVFQPSHRLPTMSIDEYLAEEERRGNILRDGGPAQAAQATPREQRAEIAEMDGTREAEEAEEAARKEAIEWDAFTESNKRGAGNTINRG